MKKFTAIILSVIIICGAFCSCDIKDGGGEINSTTLPAENVQYSVFGAVITDISGTSVTVRPNDTENIRKSSDSVVFSCDKLDDIGAAVGDTVYIAYSGTVRETYPAQIDAYSWAKDKTELEKITVAADESGESASDGSIVEEHTRTTAHDTIDNDGRTADLVITEISTGKTAYLSSEFAEEFHKVLNSHRGAWKNAAAEINTGYTFLYSGTKYTVDTANSLIATDNKKSAELTAEDVKILSQLISPTDFMDKATAAVGDTSADGAMEYTLTITAIYPDCFLADMAWPYYEKYKVIAAIDSQYCVNDNVSVKVTSLSKDENNHVELYPKSVEPSDFEIDPNAAYKPVIYLYPEEETKVNVKLSLNGVLTHSYPVYRGEWNVTARPDGTLSDGTAQYDYLFWEGVLESRYDYSEGFCVKGTETEDFLREKLAFLGLNDSEIQDFLDFWLMRLECNPYNYISFRDTEYTENAKLSITPEPDTLIRVYMVYAPLNEEINVAPQTLIPAARSGFTAVEWGGEKTAYPGNK